MRSAAVWGVIAVWLAASAIPAAALDRTHFIAADEISAGQRGFGLTTFADTTVSRFDLTVLGVMHGWIPGGDLIIIEAAGGPLASTGIYRGMSGSPIYLDGRLAGAISYNLGSFGERAIGGVTPIAEMLPILDEVDAVPGKPDRSTDGPGQSKARTPPAARTNTERSAKAKPAGPPFAGPALRGGPAATAIRAPFADPTLRRGPAAWSAAAIEPIRTPLMLAGFHPAARQAMTTFFEELGCSIVAGGPGGAGGSGGAGGPSRGAPLRPGTPIGVQLVRGDVQATALGTVTYVDGGRVLAFGHPMFQAGPVDMPMTDARVFTVYPSQAISFVLGAAGGPRGRIVADRQTGIMGRLGESSPMLPIEIAIVDAQGRGRRFHYELVKNKFFMTQFLGFLAFNSFIAKEKSFGDVTLDMHMAIDFAEGPRLEFDDVLASFTAPGELAQQVSQPLAGILLSGIEPVELRNVELELRVSPEVRLASIDEIMVDRSEVHPGDTIGVTVQLRRFEAERQAIRLEVEVPRAQRPGQLLLRACSAEDDQQWEHKRAPRRFVPETLQQYVDLYEESTARNVLRLTMHEEARGVVVGGREMMGLPSSVFRVMDSGNRAGGRSGSWGRLVHRQLVKTDWQLSGCRELPITVRGPAVTVAPRPGWPDITP